MKKRNLFTILTVGILFVTGCTKQTVVIVKNTLDVKRQYETVALGKDQLIPFSDHLIDGYTLKDKESGEIMTVQYVDIDGDGTSDEILFQPEIPANTSKSYVLIKSDIPVTTDSIPGCYSRFVPERTDDYAWENNRVAFRTYGPTAQKMIEENIPGGTLSSGIDAWLKRVDYPIINKWYHKELKTDGSYHQDTGEGLDNFHVGASRGVGGIAVKKDSSYYISKNFTEWETITSGPIRTSFVLKYKNWDVNGNLITEEKHISLDYGSNLSRFNIKVKGTDTLSVGLTLHEKDGSVSADLEEGWLSYWEDHGDSELGTGIVVPNRQLVGYEEFLTEEKDSSNLYGHLKVINGEVTYFAGFGWKKSDQFKNEEAWLDYLEDFAKKINHPLTIEIR
ncbi:DUF4861 domain-containing protein [Zhouia spongiae]|uniref:DUF4861 domain-containing protein n=1 Tax=Zhouia spongiae TaxID=2202721 RepID=A0ABY3YHY1_9FLAO|nr:DUF4861 domain-containing protein [Zhouia spongiae]UNY97469.1 DUF4861 domain-containing protein [Zhouia spongiae]